MRNVLVHIYISISAALLAFCACSQAPTAGTGSQAGNGKVECVVRDVNGLALRDMIVTMKKITITHHDDSICAQWIKYTDETGACTFDSLPPGSFSATSFNGVQNMMALASKIRPDANTKVAMTYAQTTVFKGRLLAGFGISVPQVDVFIPGSGTMAKPDSNGFFVLPVVPVGQHDICFRYNSTVNYLPVGIDHYVPDTAFLRDVNFAPDAASANAVYGFYDNAIGNSYSIVSNVYDSTTQPSWYSGKDFSKIQYYKVVVDSLKATTLPQSVFTILEDFDDRDSLTLLNAITHGSYWYVVTDAQDTSGTTIMAPPGIESQFTKGITSLDAFHGSSFFATFYMGHLLAGNNAPYGYIGFAVQKNGSKYADFSKMTAFSFMLKGKGTIRVVFRTSKAMHYPSAYWWGQMSVVIPCPTEWTSITIVPDSIKAPNKSQQQINGLTWDMAKDSVDRIEFAAWKNAGDTVSMALDDIKVNGMLSSDFK